MSEVCCFYCPFTSEKIEDLMSHVLVCDKREAEVKKCWEEFNRTIDQVLNEADKIMEGKEY